MGRSVIETSPLDIAQQANSHLTSRSFSGVRFARNSAGFRLHFVIFPGEVPVNYVENHADTSPPTNTALLMIAGVLLAIPVVALLWIGSYASVEPTMAGFPFFIWYQFVWVFLCAACTWGAYRVVRIARPSPKEGRR